MLLRDAQDLRSWFEFSTLPKTRPRNTAKPLIRTRNYSQNFETGHKIVRNDGQNLRNEFETWTLPKTRPSNTAKPLIRTRNYSQNFDFVYKTVLNDAET